VKLLTADGTYSPSHKATANWWDTSSSSSITPRTVQLAARPGGVLQYATFLAILRQNPWVWACVQKLSTGMARLPLKVYRLNPDGSRERARSDTPGGPPGANGLDRLLRTPGVGIAGSTLRRKTVADQLVHGNALWRVSRDPGTLAINGLRHYRWRDVYPLLNRDESEVLMWRVMQDGQLLSLTPEEVIHFGSGSNPDGPLGISPLEPLARELGIFDAVERQLLSFFANQARPSGVLNLKGASPEAIKLVRDQVQEMYASPENSGRILTSTGDFTPISSAPAQAQVIEVMRITREAACAVYDVAPPIIGDLSQGVKSNVQEMREQYHRDALGPKAGEFEAELEAQLLPLAGSLWAGLFVEHDFAEVLRPTPLDEAEALNKAWELTLDEKRRIRNMPALNMPGLSDVPMVPAGVYALGTTPTPAPAPAPPAAPRKPKPADDEDV
jgi:HK97 family phage portal protein